MNIVTKKHTNYLEKVKNIVTLQKVKLSHAKPLILPFALGLSLSTAYSEGFKKPKIIRDMTW